MKTRFRSLTEFKNELITEPQLQNEFRNNPVQAANMIQQENPLGTDAWIYRIVVISLGATVLAIIIGVIWLMLVGKIADDKSVPSILTAMGSAAIGALAGLLAPSPKDNSNG